MKPLPPLITSHLIPPSPTPHSITSHYISTHSGWQPPNTAILPVCMSPTTFINRYTNLRFNIYSLHLLLLLLLFLTMSCVHILFCPFRADAETVFGNAWDVLKRCPNITLVRSRTVVPMFLRSVTIHVTYLALLHNWLPTCTTEWLTYWVNSWLEKTRRAKVVLD